MANADRSTSQQSGRSPDRSTRSDTGRRAEARACSAAPSRMPATKSPFRGSDPWRRSLKYFAQAQSSAVSPVQTRVHAASAWFFRIHRAVAPTFRADTASSASGAGYWKSPRVPFDVAWIRRRPSSCATDISSGEFPKSKSAGLSPATSPTSRRSGCCRQRPRPASADGAQTISAAPRSKATAAVVNARMTSMTMTTVPAGTSASIPTIVTERDSSRQEVRPARTFRGRRPAALPAHRRRRPGVALSGVQMAVCNQVFRPLFVNNFSGVWRGPEIWHCRSLKWGCDHAGRPG